MQHIKFLGSGNFGKVYLYRNNKDNTYFAIKKINNNDIKNNKMKYTFWEVLFIYF